MVTFPLFDHVLQSIIIGFSLLKTNIVSVYFDIQESVFIFPPLGRKRKCKFDHMNKSTNTKNHGSSSAIIKYHTSRRRSGIKVFMVLSLPLYIPHSGISGDQIAYIVTVALSVAVSLETGIANGTTFPGAGVSVVASLLTDQPI